LAASACVMALACGLALNWDSAWLELPPGRDEAESAEADIAFLKERPGAALCETLSFCYWAGKDAQVDVFNTGQAFATGARDDAALVRLVRARRYGALEFDSMKDFALGPRVKQ